MLQFDHFSEPGIFKMTVTKNSIKPRESKEFQKLTFLVKGTSIVKSKILMTDRKEAIGGIDYMIAI